MCEVISDRAYRIYGLKDVALAMKTGSRYTISVSKGLSDPGFKKAFTTALTSGAESFESGGVNYLIKSTKKNATACIVEPLALATTDIFDFANADFTAGYDFRCAAEAAMGEMRQGGLKNFSFDFNGEKYKIASEAGTYTISVEKDGEQVLFANVSAFAIQAIYPDVFLTLDFKAAVKEAIAEGKTSFTAVNEDGSSSQYTVERKSSVWTVRWIESTEVVDAFGAPSPAHVLGTDGSGMDMLTRLMYGGRVSLMIGFIVVFIELIIGVVIGGIAGYFGKFLDNLLMRIVDIFNCIPSLPLIIIIGAVMDGVRMDPQLRMVYLMVILGILGWPGVARLVRGQILSLREQEFMVAAEATGISVNRRIFRHLIPNVIPQLIVYSTLSLGNVIILESTLSFLGLGVKFPFASWGNIINAVSNVFVMTNYLFVWIPAGLCIIITVLGFNFIGDGLRDAFDPKMKR
jgi:peptide/nickel transport system permease protein